MKVAICDDERYHRNILADKVKKYLDSSGIVATVTLHSSASSLLKESIAQYDLIFLDVSMREIDGLEAGRVIAKKSASTVLVYVSGLIEYAPASHEIDNTIRYLLKSQIDEKFDECMDATLKRLNYQSKKILIDFTQGEMAVYRHEIVYVISFGHVLTFHFTSPKKEPLESRKYALKELVPLLGEDLFVRIDQSCIVNMAHIDDIMKDSQGYRCILTDNTALFISQRRYGDVKRKYYLYTGSL